MMRMADISELKRYQALLELARSLGRVMEMNALLDEILRRSQEVIGIEACSILLPDRETGELIIHSARGDKAPMLFATRIPKGMGVAGLAYESGKTITIKDAQNDPRHYSKVDEKTGFVTRSLITVPLLNGGERLGVLQAMNPVERDFFDEKDEAICEAFSGLIVSALLRIEAQKREVEQVKVKQEMELANEIQLSFLPESVVMFESCRLWMQYTPARQIGGDFCFVHPSEDQKKYLIGLGDVTGKGVPAALTMARVTATIKAMSHRLGNDFGAWVTDLNLQLISDLRAGRFIGLTFMLADEAAETLHVCAAGQYAPFHMDGNKWEKIEVPKQLPLGILPGFNYTSQKYPLKKGDCWMLFSDGITEARNSAGEEFTEQRFFKSLETGMPAEAMFEKAIETWKNFVGDAPQHDDASLLFLEWSGGSPPGELKQICDPSTMREGRNFIEAWAHFAGFDDVTVGQIVLACDEAATNIYRHAYKGKSGPIVFRAMIYEGVFVIQIEDEGEPINPEKIQSRKQEKLQPGGLGVVVISKVFDEVEYQPRTKGTLLTFKKRIISNLL